eukprot:735606-Hanusia_phi.AAC.1
MNGRACSATSREQEVKSRLTPVQMTPLGSDGSVVIAGLGLRLAPTPTDPLLAHPKCTSADEGRCFVTELVAGGAAERSNLLKVNDEILH